ncbi:D-proline reductase proprotein PrdA [Natranaerofaba carboxydovora]|nr:D-proline reductase proprotein PrdA [Natranaerofaba carboxydovora]
MNRRLQLIGHEINSVYLGECTKIEKEKLCVNENLASNIVSKYSELKDINIRVLSTKNENTKVNTIMDVIPIQTKNEEHLGTGITMELEGVVVVLTGKEQGGKQVAEFGSTAGKLTDKIAFNKPGCPDEDDLIINIDITIEDGISMTRDGPTACHRAADEIIQDIRNVMKKELIDDSKDRERIIKENDPKEYKNKPNVLLVKEMMGQGGMHDNTILPLEPCGVIGGKSVVDMGNVPVMLCPNEVQDGAIHAMTCVAPSTKETTRHYSRDPLIQRIDEDEELYFGGVIAVGSPQSNHEKEYTAKRVGMIVEKVNPDGVIVMTEGYGNNHIDFARHIEEIGKREFPVVGVTYAAKKGALVIGNKYMDAMVELSKSESQSDKGSEILAENTLIKEDADRAVWMLKDKLFNEGKNVKSEVFVPKEPPVVWSKPPKDLKNTEVALVSAAGIHLKDQEPFNVAGDNTYRVIPGDVDSDRLMVTHGGYDHKDVRKDINCMFPIDRLNELSREGFIKNSTEIHIGFMGGGGDFEAFNDYVGPDIADELNKVNVGAAVLTAG